MASIEQALAEAGVTPQLLRPADVQTLDAEGYAMLRGVYAPDIVEELRASFEAGVRPSEQWPMPREAGTRHAMVDHDRAVRRACLAPLLLAAAHHLLKGRFYFCDVLGRDPMLRGGQQSLHRDWPDDGDDACMVVALAYLDGFGPQNGATRLVPGTHRLRGDMNDHNHIATDPRQMQVEGEGGDVLVFHGRLVHSGMRNLSGAPRRTLQIGYRSFSLHAARHETRDLSGATPLERYLMGAD